jgi:hypothetical protein
VGSHCLQRVALTIVRLLLILAPVVVHEEIPPSISALKQLYNCTMGLSESFKVSALPCHGLALVLFIFSGRLPVRQTYSRMSAASTGGVCVYYLLLKDTDLSPSDAMDIEVIPGHIKHGEHVYNFIVDMDSPYPDGELAWSQLNFARAKITLIAEEVEDAKTLAVSYRMTGMPDLPQYLGVEAVVGALRSFVRIEVCNFEDCGASFALGPPGSDWEFQTSISIPKESLNASDSPSIVGASHDARWSVLTWESWSLPRTTDGPQQQLEIQAASPDPALLFLTITQLSSKYSKFPFKHKRSRLVVAKMGPCAICLARLACWMWSRLDTMPVDSRTVPFNYKRKTGSIKIYDAIKAERELRFELVPVVSPSRLSKMFPTLRVIPRF